MDDSSAVPPPPAHKRRLSRTTRADRIAGGTGLLALIAGFILLAVASSYIVSIVGTGLMGVAGVAFVALVFLLVGESEDRDYRKEPL
jgi:hypothetical protein